MLVCVCNADRFRDQKRNIRDKCASCITRVFQSFVSLFNVHLVHRHVRVLQQHRVAGHLRFGAHVSSLIRTRVWSLIQCVVAPQHRGIANNSCSVSTYADMCRMSFSRSAYRDRLLLGSVVASSVLLRHECLHGGGQVCCCSRINDERNREMWHQTARRVVVGRVTADSHCCLWTRVCKRQSRVMVVVALGLMTRERETASRPNQRLLLCE